MICDLLWKRRKIFFFFGLFVIVILVEQGGRKGKVLFVYLDSVEDTGILKCVKDDYCFKIYGILESFSK